MLSTRLLSLALSVSCYLGLGLAAEQNVLNATVEAGDFVSIKLWSKPYFKGGMWSINHKFLQDGSCINLQNVSEVRSVEKIGFKCCLLYRAPCPVKKPGPHHSQYAGLFHQNIFGDYIPDLAPLGFTTHPGSIICPSDDVCTGLELDRNWSPEDSVNLAPYFVDIRAIPDRLYM